VALVNATAVIELGVGFEPWFADLYAASGSNATRITASNGVTPLQAGAEVDPHVWHDVANAIIMAQNIRDGLITAMPNKKETLTANAAAYITQLEALDNEIQAQIATLPATQRKLVTSHDTFGYFAARYGFEVVGTGLGSVTTESSDPDAASIVALVNDIKASGVQAIFVENMSNPKVMQQIAQEAGVAIAPPLNTDAMGDANSEGATYIEMMRYNVRTIVTALTGTK
jgi:ABC-type Zn uptake system ZnuABC Zn-binding protein ZnuA